MIFDLVKTLIICSLNLEQHIDAPDTNSRKWDLRIGITSSPSTEIRSQFRFGMQSGRNNLGLAVAYPEIRPAFKNWTIPDGDETSSKFAFSIDHQYELWGQKRWWLATNSIFQIQRIKVHTENGVDPSAQIFIRAYPRLQLSTGIGIGFKISKRLYLFQSIRYGVAKGNFFMKYGIVDRWHSNICADISIGIKI